jgi:hypothetical protein
MTTSDLPDPSQAIGAGSCPILNISIEVLDSAELLRRNMLRLRRQLRRCHNCQGDSCPILMEFNAKVETALNDVMKEFRIIAS